MSVLGALSGRYAHLASRDRIIQPVQVDRALRVVVSAKWQEAEDVQIVWLSSVDGSELPSWHPGAHIDLTLPSGRVRQYSLSGDPGERDTWRIAVRRIEDGGGGSVEIHDDLAVGTVLTVAGPRNAFPFAYPHLARADIRKVTFIAAGIGITAILPMVQAAAAAAVDWNLIYIGRGRSTMAFLGEIGSLPKERVRLVTGTRRSASDLLQHADSSTSVYFCGPPGFLADIRAATDTTTVAGFHFERFSPAPVIGGRPFVLELGQTGETLEVDAETTALAVVRSAVPDVPYSCQQGFCGTCRVRVVTGEVDRRGTSTFLDDPETMLICIDRAAGDAITLDL